MHVETEGLRQPASVSPSTQAQQIQACTELAKSLQGTQDWAMPSKLMSPLASHVPCCRVVTGLRCAR